MAEPTNQFDDDSEYEFKDSEPSAVYTTKPPTKSVFSKFSRKTVLFGVVGVIIVFAALNYFKPSKDLASNTVDVNSQQLLQDQKNNQLLVDQAKQKKAADAAVVLAKQQADAAAAVRLQAEQAAAAMMNKDAEQQAAVLAEKISALQKNIKSGNSNLKSLVSSNQKLQQQINALIEEQKKLQAKYFYQEPVHANTYVSAIVPGRAWVETEDGLKTVTKNNEIPGYGVVVDMNPTLGTVTTQEPNGTPRTIYYAIGN